MAPPKWATKTRSRRPRWPTYVIFLCAFFILYKLPSWILPSPPRYPTSQKKCPATPPSPPILPPPNTGFSWRDIEPQNPVEKFAQLPKVKKKALPKIQFEFDKEDDSALYGELMQKRRQSAVKATFVRCWQSYRERAWTQDELRPVTGKAAKAFGGWGATLVDSLDTLLIMDMKTEFAEAVEAVAEIDFKPENAEEINMFETTIRYLGGLLAAYDLTDCKDSRLLEKAIALGDMIYASFDTPNRMPITRWSARKASARQQQFAAENGIIAELASFSLEFTRLSQLTGDMRYYDAVTRVTAVLASQQNDTRLPGLWPVGIDVQTPDLTQDTQFSLGALADSAYEYLGKTYQLLHGVGDALQYKKMYEFAMDSVIKYILFRPMVPDRADILFPTVVRANDPNTFSQDYQGQHLVCFVGGMLLLGGRLTGNETHVDYGRRVTDACVWTYQNAPYGIMPEMFTMEGCPSHASCPFDDSIKQQHPGFTHVSDARYMLRPEAIESVFYMYRITGDSAYQDIAWDMFQAIDSRSRTEFANAAIRDVMLDDKVKEDKMESFWLAETLKYFYLIFSEPEYISLDKWVFNTEAHPFRL